MEPVSLLMVASFAVDERSVNVLAICSCISYLFLALWFGLHAFVAAQAYKVRILTQLVRLPIPSWTHMEAARTYGSDYESMGTKQMLRVPVVTGSQELLTTECNEFYHV
eukprot:s1075_g19.t1